MGFREVSELATLTCDILTTTHSWHQQFQNAAGPTLEDLNRRLRECDEINGVHRRPSMWHHGSVGSNLSSNGSFSYTSPQQQHQQRVSQTSPGYMQSSPSGGQQQASSYMDHQHVSPPQHYQQMAAPQFLPQQGSVQYVHQPQQQPTYQLAPQQQQPQQFTFNEPVYPAPPSFSAAPIQQFANWGGYGGPSVPDTLDEENAVPPKLDPWEMTQR